MHLHRWRGAAAGLATACLAVVTPARAQPTDSHAAAEALVGQLGADARAQLATDAVGQARAALERATRMRATGDERHAKAADELALEWAQMARDLLRAVEGETAAADVRKRSVDAQAQLERTRAAVEEGIARVGRLRAELAEAEAGARDRRPAVEVHDGEPAKKKPDDAARKKPAGPKKKPQPTGDAP